MGDRDARVFVIARVLSLRTGSHTSTRSHIRRRARGGARGDDEGGDRSSRSAVLVVRAVPLIADDERAMRRDARRHRQSLSLPRSHHAHARSMRTFGTRDRSLRSQSPIDHTRRYDDRRKIRPRAHRRWDGTIAHRPIARGRGETRARTRTHRPRLVDTSIDTHPAVEEIRVVIVVMVIISASMLCGDDARGRGGGRRRGSCIDRSTCTCSIVCIVVLYGTVILCIV